MSTPVASPTCILYPSPGDRHVQYTSVSRVGRETAVRAYSGRVYQMHKDTKKVRFML